MGNLIKIIIDNFLHLDKNLAIVISQYGILTYIFIFLILFAETGFVVTPFLPGDSLLFAAGALSVTTTLNVWWLFIILSLAAILGDTVNYWIGHYVGPKVFETKNRFLKKVLKKEYLVKTQKFYDKYGGKAIILARFVPIIRTFAPFVAGVASMSYKHFITYNIIGGILWVSLFTFSGYFFGNIPFIKQNFHYVVIVIILISIVPILMEFVKSIRSKQIKLEATN